MRRFILLATLLVAGIPTIRNVCAETPEETKAKLKVRVAIALAAAKDEGSCGICRTDEDGCRADAIKQNKLLVLFVGGCYGRGELVVGTGAIACRADDYVGDNGAKGKPRIVLLVPKADGFEFGGILSATATDAEIKKAIETASPKKKISIDWYTPDAGNHSTDPATSSEPAANSSTVGAIIYSIPTVQPVCRNCK